MLREVGWNDKYIEYALARQFGNHDDRVVRAVRTYFNRRSSDLLQRTAGRLSIRGPRSIRGLG